MVFDTKNSGKGGGKVVCPYFQQKKGDRKRTGGCVPEREKFREGLRSSSGCRLGGGIDTSSDGVKRGKGGKGV